MATACCNWLLSLGLVSANHLHCHQVSKASHQACQFAEQSEIKHLVQAWRINSEEIQYRNQIGSGSYGKVWEATYREMTVAVKIVENVNGMLGSELDPKVERELEFMRRTRHQNIVLFLGGGRLDTGQGLFLVMEARLT